MLKIEKEYKATAFFNESKDTTWDSLRDKTYKVSLFGLTIFKRVENLNIDYSELEPKKLGFKK